MEATADQDKVEVVRSRAIANYAAKDSAMTEVVKLGHSSLARTSLERFSEDRNHQCEAHRDLHGTWNCTGGNRRDKLGNGGATVSISKIDLGGNPNGIIASHPSFNRSQVLITWSKAFNTGVTRKASSQWSCTHKPSKPRSPRTPPISLGKHQRMVWRPDGPKCCKIGESPSIPDEDQGLWGSWSLFPHHFLI